MKDITGDNANMNYRIFFKNRQDRKKTVSIIVYNSKSAWKIVF